MGALFHYIFVILANLVGWGLLIAAVVGFFGVVWVLCTDKPKGTDPNDPNQGSGMPWG